MNAWIQKDQETSLLEFRLSYRVLLALTWKKISTEAFFNSKKTRPLVHLGKYFAFIILFILRYHGKGSPLPLPWRYRQQILRNCMFFKVYTLQIIFHSWTANFWLNSKIIIEILFLFTSKNMFPGLSNGFRWSWKLFLPFSRFVGASYVGLGELTRKF